MTDTPRTRETGQETEHEPGPFCALCGACKKCVEANPYAEPFCWDDPWAEPRTGKHLWNREPAR